MGWDKSTLHAEHIAKLLDAGFRKKEGIFTSSEARERALAKDEAEAQGQIASYLRLLGIEFIRPDMRKKSALPLGWPDFTFAHKGVPIALEVKVWGQKPEPHQTARHEAMRANGWHVAVVSGVEDVQRILRDQP